jgi:hypothetical protein
MDYLSAGDGLSKFMMDLGAETENEKDWETASAIRHLPTPPRLLSTALMLYIQQLATAVEQTPVIPRASTQALVILLVETFGMLALNAQRHPLSNTRRHFLFIAAIRILDAFRIAAGCGSIDYKVAARYAGYFIKFWALVDPSPRIDDFARIQVLERIRSLNWSNPQNLLLSPLPCATRPNSIYANERLLIQIQVIYPPYDWPISAPAFRREAKREPGLAAVLLNDPTIMKLALKSGDANLLAYLPFASPRLQTELLRQFELYIPPEDKKRPLGLLVYGDERNNLMLIRDKTEHRALQCLDDARIVESVNLLLDGMFDYQHVIPERVSWERRFAKYLPEIVADATPGDQRVLGGGRRDELTFRFWHHELPKNSTPKFTEDVTRKFYEYARDYTHSMGSLFLDPRGNNAAERLILESPPPPILIAQETEDWAQIEARLNAENLVEANKDELKIKKSLLEEAGLRREDAMRQEQKRKSSSPRAGDEPKPKRKRLEQWKCHSCWSSAHWINLATLQRLCESCSTPIDS